MLPVKPIRLVSCPVCGQPSPFDPSNAHRPFCSKRCKLIDLGQWASESYSLPANGDPNDEVPGGIEATESAE